MRFLHFIFFCFLSAVFYLLLSIHSSHTPPQLFTAERKPARKYLSTSFSSHKSEFPKAKVHKEGLNGPFMEEVSSKTLEHEARNDNLSDLVYHTDYHGVTTHPNPTPKHPIP